MAFTRPKAAQIDFDVTNISDPLIRLNSGQSGSADKDVGIVVERGSDTNVALLYDESADEFVLVNTTEDGTTSGNVTISSYADLKVGEIQASSGTMSGAIAMGTNKITGLGDPTADQDAATKAYVDTQLTAEDLDITSDSGTIAIDLDSETLTIAGGTGIDSSATSNTVTLAIDSTVATLTGTQTLENKTLRAPTFEGGSNAPEFIEQRFVNATQQNFVQLYTGGSSGSYFTQGEYQKIATITPDGDSQNYTFIIRMTATSASNYQIVTFSGALRSNTLPDLTFTSNYYEEHNGTRFIEPKLWTKETTTAGFILAFEYIHNANLYGGVNVEATIIPRSDAQRANVSFNTTQDSEISSIDTGFTENDPTLIYANVSGTLEFGTQFRIEGSTADGNETTITATDPTADRTITFPDATGTVALTSDISLSTLSVTATASELNIMDGGTSATSTTVADADRLVLNDNGTMVQVAVTDLNTYFQSNVAAGSNQQVQFNNSGALGGDDGLTYNSTGGNDSNGLLTAQNATVTNRLSLGGSGSQFFAFNEDTVKVKFANWYSSNDRQYGQGQLWYELFFAAVDSTDSSDNRRIGFYLEEPNNGASDADDWSGSGAHPTNPAAFISTSAFSINYNNQLRLHEDATSLDIGTNYIAIQQPTSLSANRTLTLPDATGTLALLEGDQTFTDDITITGNLTVNGTTTTISTTNSRITDSLIELNNGAGSNANDLGFVFERGSTGDNAAIIWDESADVFVVGTTTATGDSTGNLTVTPGTLNVGTLQIGGTAVTSTATELNLLDGVTGLTLGSANEILIVGTGGTAITSTSVLSIDDSNNYIGINQTSPAVTLHMTGEGAQTAQIRMEQHNDSADAPDIRTRKSRGTAASSTKNNAGDFIFRGNFERYNGSAYTTVGQLAVDANSSNADRFQLTLTVSEDGSSIDAADAQLKIDGNDSGAITFNGAYKFPTSDGTANQVLQTDGSGTLTFADQSGGLSNIVEDTTPQLGGNLDTNSNNILIDDAHYIADENGNEQIVFSTTASAVNSFQVTNAATGNAVDLAAVGGDTNIDINLTPKGSGEINIAAGNLNYAGTAVTATGAELNYLDGVTGITLDNAGDLLIVGTDGTSIDSSALLNIDTGNGRLGIGTTSPARTLHLVGDTQFEGSMRIDQYHTSADGPDVLLQKARGTPAAPTVNSAGDELGKFVFYTHNGTSFLDRAIIRSVATLDGSEHGGTLEFRTGNNASPSARMTIDENGNVTFADGTTDVDIASHDGTNGLKLGGTLVTSSATELNLLDGVTGTLVTEAGTQTLTNKTLTSPTITGTGAIAGTFTGNITGDVTGNADTATALATARNIAGNSFDGSGDITIASTDLSDTSNLVRNNQNNTITSTTAGSSAAPEFELFRDITGADANYIGQIKFSADNDADQKTVFAKITGKIGDASDGTEDGIIEIAHIKAGSQNINVRMTSTEFKILNGTDFDIETHDGSSAGLRLNNTLVTATAAELNILDGDTSATSTTLADADRVVVNDAGTMKQVALTDFETYFETALDTLSNVTSVGTLNGLAVASSQTISLGSNRVQNVADPVGNQDAATKAYVDANAGSGGGASGFTASTTTTAPGSDGDFDLSFNVAQDTQETPFESGGSDAFGVSLGEVYDQMEPVGSTSSVDLGVLT